MKKINKELKLNIEKFLINNKIELPFLLFDIDSIKENINFLSKLVNETFPKNQILYSYKSNNLKAICHIMKENSIFPETGSLDEIKMAIEDGNLPKNIYFNGPLKKEDEIIFAINNRIKIQVDNIEELEIINNFCKNKNIKYQIGIRLAHLYNENISNFGFSENELIIAENKSLLNNEFITVNGIHIHSGSNAISLDKLDKTICKYKNVIRKYLKNNESENYLNLGGSIPTNSASKDNVNEYIHGLYDTIKKYNACDLNKIKIIFEMGRYFLEDNGYFIFKLHRWKERYNSDLYISDIGISWLPSLNSWEHSLESIKNRDTPPLLDLDKNQIIMGFNCFENDYITSSVKNIILHKDDIFIIRDCGAYDIQTSNYWTRVGREIYAIEKGHFELIRRKQTYKELRLRDIKNIPYLELDNLTLYPPSVNFSKELYSLIEKNKNYLSKYLNWVKYISSEEDIKDFLLQSMEDFNSISKIYIIKYDERLVGVISLDNLDKSNGIAYIGYWLSEDAQGKGIISKSINTLIESHKDLYRKYIIKCSIHNKKSNSVAIRNGFKHECLLVESELINGIYYNQNQYFKLINT